MTNAYFNQFNNIPPRNTTMKVGMKINTRFGLGTITEITYPIFRGESVHSSIIATIMVPLPGKQPIVFQWRFNTMVFSSNVGSEATIRDQFNNNF
jgi:hypothetical protein